MNWARKRERFWICIIILKKGRIFHQAKITSLDGRWDGRKREVISLIHPWSILTVISLPHLIPMFLNTNSEAHMPCFHQPPYYNILPLLTFISHPLISCTKKTRNTASFHEVPFPALQIDFNSRSKVIFNVTLENWRANRLKRRGNRWRSPGKVKSAFKKEEKWSEQWVVFIGIVWKEERTWLQLWVAKLISSFLHSQRSTILLNNGRELAKKINVGGRWDFNRNPTRSFELLPVQVFVQ